MYHIQRIMRVIKKEWTFVLNSSEFVQLSVFKFVEKTSVFFDPNEFSGPQCWYTASDFGRWLSPSVDLTEENSRSVHIQYHHRALSSSQCIIIITLHHHIASSSSQWIIIIIITVHHHIAWSSPQCIIIITAIIIITVHHHHHSAPSSSQFIIIIIVLEFGSPCCSCCHRYHSNSHQFRYEKRTQIRVFIINRNRIFSCVYDNTIILYVKSNQRVS